MTTAPVQQFLQTLSQQVSSVINISLLKHINTGDRVFDTSIQLMFTTILSALMSVVIVLLTNPQLVNGYMQRIKTILGFPHNPLNFNPMLAPKAPKNGKKFMYRYTLGFSSTNFIEQGNAFVSWFYTHIVVNEFYIDNLTSSLLLPDPGKNLLDRSNVYWASKSTMVEDGIYFPIWYSKNGEWVYFNTRSDWMTYGFTLYSDSAKALYECLESIKEHSTKVKDYEIQKFMRGDGQRMLNEVDIGKDGVVSKELCSIPMNRTFDKMFFDQKEKILPVLEAFREKRLVPANLPIDNKLGILLHGPPGTGKTGFISALANYLGRNILLCDMSKIRTRAHLSQIFMNHKNEQYIFVFEEFDTMPGVCKREGLGGPSGPGGQAAVAPNDTNNPAFAMMLMAEKEKSEILREMKNEMAEAKDKIDLGFLLRKLDGLESGEGRIIVATTNHPERIDPALLRPGRFGLHLNLGNCSHSMLENIIWMGCAKGCGCETSKEELAEKVKEIPEGKWAPAFVIQTCLEFGGNIDKVLEVLSS